MGTRFAATVESSAPEAFKQMYVDATPDDVVLIKSPVGLPGGRSRTRSGSVRRSEDYPRIPAVHLLPQGVSQRVLHHE